ncbi:MAG: hypothetical protein SVZ03_16580 [Spirochaetota bacterium]|nr:hypothetical protein [Spirochaetota bacterium]
MAKKLKIFGIILILVLIAGIFVYFRYFFTYEQRNIVKRKIEVITGQNLTVTIFGFDGKIIKRWNGVQKITSGKEGRNYTYFYTRDGKYVQIPNSVWYVAEEE